MRDDEDNEAAWVVLELGGKAKRRESPCGFSGPDFTWVRTSVKIYKMDITNIKYHLEFYADESTQIAHYGNMAVPIMLPRVGDQVHFHNHEITLKVTRVVHEFVAHFADEPTRFTLSHVVKVYGDKAP